MNLMLQFFIQKMCQITLIKLNLQDDLIIATIVGAFLRLRETHNALQLPVFFFSFFS